MLTTLFLAILKSFLFVFFLALVVTLLPRRGESLAVNGTRVLLLTLVLGFWGHMEWQEYQVRARQRAYTEAMREDLARMIQLQEVAISPSPAESE